MAKTRAKKSAASPTKGMRSSSSTNKIIKKSRKPKPHQTPEPDVDQCFTYEDATLEQDADGRTKQGCPKRWYVYGLLPHLQGVRHPPDRTREIHPQLNLLNPFAVALRKVALRTKYQPLTDTSTWKKLFDAAMDGNLETFESTLQSMNSPRCPDPMQPAACLAAGYSHHEVLRYCLENGAKLDQELTKACIFGANSRQMWDVMIDHDWKKIRTSTKAAQREIEKCKTPAWDWVVKHLQDRCYPPGYDEWEHDPLNPKNFKKYNDDGTYTAAYVLKYMPELA